jgi:hypothetical protein
MSGSSYLAVVPVSGLCLLYVGIRLSLEKTRAQGLRVLLAYVLYLPVAFFAIAVDKR